ncbi:hypothetical protein JCM10213v2_007233 [Rhodosporidiobolus nylandii]
MAQNNKQDLEQGLQKPKKASSPSLSLALHLHPLDFVLPTSPSKLVKLSTTELALGWLLSPPGWDDNAHLEPVIEELRKRWTRFDEALGGNGKEVKANDVALFGRKGLEWEIPYSLAGLEPEQLAVLPLHPDFDCSLLEPARAVFRQLRYREVRLPSPFRSADPLDRTIAATPCVSEAGSWMLVDQAGGVVEDAAVETREVQERASREDKPDLGENHVVEPVLPPTSPRPLIPPTAEPSSPSSPGYSLFFALPAPNALTADADMDAASDASTAFDPDQTLVDPEPKSAETLEQETNSFLDGLALAFQVAKAMSEPRRGESSPEDGLAGPFLPAGLPSKPNLLARLGPPPPASTNSQLSSPVTHNSRTKQQKQRPKPYSDPSRTDPSLHVPKSLTRTWSTIFVSNIPIKISHAFLWGLLAPPHLPEPVAIRLVPRPGQTFALCFVAYGTAEDAHLGAHGLNGVVYGEKRTVLSVGKTDKAPAAYDWPWSETSEAYREAHQPKQPAAPKRPRLTAPDAMAAQREEAPPPALFPSDYVDASPPLPPQHRLISPLSSAPFQALSSNGVVPPALLSSAVSVFLDNLPLDVSVDALRAYLLPFQAIGIALNSASDPRLPFAPEPEPCRSAFLLFRNLDAGERASADVLARRGFPGSTQSLWWTRMDKPDAWRWSEMDPEWAKQNGGPSESPAPSAALSTFFSNPSIPVSSRLSSVVRRDERPQQQVFSPDRSEQLPFPPAPPHQPQTPSFPSFPYRFSLDERAVADHVQPSEPLHAATAFSYNYHRAGPPSSWQQPAAHMSLPAPNAYSHPYPCPQLRPEHALHPPSFPHPAPQPGPLQRYPHCHRQEPAWHAPQQGPYW